jgi:hypothetical protein
MAQLPRPTDSTPGIARADRRLGKETGRVSGVHRPNTSSRIVGTRSAAPVLVPQARGARIISPSGEQHGGERDLRGHQRRPCRTAAGRAPCRRCRRSSTSDGRSADLQGRQQRDEQRGDDSDGAVNSGVVVSRSSCSLRCASGPRRQSAAPGRHRRPEEVSGSGSSLAAALSSPAAANRRRRQPQQQALGLNWRAMRRLAGARGGDFAPPRVAGRPQIRQIDAAQQDEAHGAKDDERARRTSPSAREA